MEKLEDSVDIAPISTNEGNRFSKAYNSLTNYLVDVSAGWTFTTPLYGITEFLSGMENEEILKSRALSLIANAVFMRPYGKFRKSWANHWNTIPESSKKRKFVTETTAFSIIQIPLYSTMLYLAGASFEEWMVALPMGLVMGVATGRPFGIWQDKCRQFWGKEPVLSKDKINQDKYD